MLEAEEPTPYVPLGGAQRSLLRRHRLTQGGVRRDTVIFSIIRPEWEGLRQTVFREYYA